MPYLGSALALLVLGLYQTVLAVAIAVDAVSGASGGRKMVTISAIDVTLNSASITYSEGYRNGGFRFYHTTTAFANASDTNRATVTKMNVSTRGSGTLRLTNLNAGTKYFYRFQGYYPRGQNNYWASGSFTTQVSTSVSPRSAAANEPTNAPRDLLGRKPGQASGVSVDETGSAPVLRH